MKRTTNKMPVAAMAMIAAMGLSGRASAQAPAAAVAEGPSAEMIKVGEGLYQQFCIICHGPVGAGSFIGPSIVSPAVRAKTDRDLRKSISEGNNDKGMPAFGRGLKKTEMDGLIGHIRSMQSKSAEKKSGREEAFPVAPGGNPIAGEEVFRGKGECIKCHTVSYTGAQIGPELTTIGERLSPGAIYKAVSAPGDKVGFDYKVKEVKLQDGRAIKGKMRGETGKSVQILNGEGNLWTTYMTDDMATSKTLKESLMPEKILEKLTPQETQDLFAFLVDLK